MRLSSAKKRFLVFATAVIAVFVYILVFSANMVSVVCEEEAKAAVKNVINESNGVVRSLGVLYDDYFTVLTDDDNKVVMITSNSALINQVSMIIQTEIQNRLNNLREQCLYIPTGAFTGLSVLSSYGTKIPFNARLIGNCTTVFSSEFREMGINQTLHRLQINCCVEIELTVPRGKIQSDVTNQILITESVIVGQVPSTFLGENTTTDYLDLLPD